MRPKNSGDMLARPVPSFLKDDPALPGRIPFPDRARHGQIEHALIERIKELNCLYGVVRLAEKHQSSIDRFLQDLANFLPKAWQYADKTAARINFKNRNYQSAGFKITNWRQAAPVSVYGEIVGECTICYLEECPPEDEGPFLKEERVLLDTVAEQIGNLAARIAADEDLQEANRQLKLERQALQETNTALKVVLSRQQQEKREIQKDIGNNVNKVLLPIINSLASQIPPAQQKYIDLLAKSLEEMTSPFISKLASTCYCLSPTEIAISNMIKNGLTTKEIADLRGVAVSTINRHRENIRRKLTITNHGVNLATFLQSNLVESN